MNICMSSNTQNTTMESWNKCSAHFVVALTLLVPRV
jgi:hypothetical protein